MKSKKLLLVGAMVLLFSLESFSQVSYGLRAGLDYNLKSDIVDKAKEVDIKSNAGYHFGGFLRVKVPIVGIFVMPEVLYRYKKTPLKIDNATSDITHHKLEIPMLLGMKFIKIINLYLGPVASINLSSKTEFKDATNAVDFKNDPKRISFLIGTGLELWKFMVDVRYQVGFAKNETTISTVQSTTNTNPIPAVIVNEKDSFVSFSVAYKF